MPCRSSGDIFESIQSAGRRFHSLHCVLWHQVGTSDHVSTHRVLIWSALLATTRLLKVMRIPFWHVLTGTDYVSVSADGDQLPQAAQVIIDQIKILSSPPTNGRSFLVTDVYGRGTHTQAGDDYVQRFVPLLVILSGWTKYYQHLHWLKWPAHQHTPSECCFRELRQDLGWCTRIGSRL